MGSESAIKRSRLAYGKGLVFLAVGLLLLGWLLNTPPGLLGKADAVGYAVCHRIDARSFHLGDRQIPLCARCSGMYLGAVLGLAFLAMRSPKRGGMPARRTWPALGLMVLAFGVDGLNSYLHFFPGFPTLYETQNWTRLATGLGMGVVMASVLYPAFSQTVWRTWDERPALDGHRSLLVLLALGAFLFGLVLWENPLILYPLALISSAGVLLILVMVYSLVLLMVFKAENRFDSLPQALLPLAGGLGLALVQIATLDYVRYWLTGTWGGFPFG